MDQDKEFASEIAKELRLSSSPPDFKGMRQEIRDRISELHPDRHGGEFASQTEERLFGLMNLARKYLDKLIKHPPRPTRMDGPLSSGDFKDLVGNDLSGVTFVRDYLQLEFNQSRLNVYCPIKVDSKGGAAKFGDGDFSKHAIGQIDKVVASVEYVSGEAMKILFEDGSRFELTLNPDEVRGPEAFNYWGLDETLLVE